MVIDEQDIADGMQRRINGLAGFPRIVWENQNVSPVPKPPYAIVELFPVSRASDALDGSGIISRGYMLVTLVHAAGSMASKARKQAQGVLDLFPPTLQIDIDSGRIVIDRSMLAVGYDDPPYWRQPVRIDYYAFGD